MACASCGKLRKSAANNIKTGQYRAAAKDIRKGLGQIIQNVAKPRRTK